MFVLNVMQNIQENYEGLSTGFLLSTGIAAAVGVLILGFLLSLIKWKKNIIEAETEI